MTPICRFSSMLFILIICLCTPIAVNADDIVSSPTHTTTASHASVPVSHPHSVWTILLEAIGILVVISLAVLFAFRPINPLRLAPRKAIRAQSAAHLSTPRTH